MQISALACKNTRTLRYARLTRFSEDATIVVVENIAGTIQRRVKHSESKSSIFSWITLPVSVNRSISAY